MHDLVFLLDLDNTILDNDGVKRDIEARMLEVLGDRLAARFWGLYEEVRKDLDVIDFYDTTRRLREEHPEDTARIDLATADLMSWDFRSRLVPQALETIAHLESIGLPVVLSDGDPVFQPMKIHQCGVNRAVDGRVLIFVHKEKYIPSVRARFPARHYVLADDKPGILMRCKAQLGDRLTTVHVQHGKYALDPKYAVDYVPDMAVANFGDLRGVPAEAFVAKAGAPA